MTVIGSRNLLILKLKVSFDSVVVVTGWVVFHMFELSYFTNGVVPICDSCCTYIIDLTYFSG